MLLWKFSPLNFYVSIIKHLGVGSLSWNSLIFLDLDICSFLQVREVFNHYYYFFFNKLSTLSPSGISIMWILVCLMVSLLRYLHPSSFFKKIILLFLKLHCPVFQVTDIYLFHLFCCWAPLFEFFNFNYCIFQLCDFCLVLYYVFYFLLLKLSLCSVVQTLFSWP